MIVSLLNKQNEQHTKYRLFCKQKQLKWELWPTDSEKKIRGWNYYFFFFKVQ